MVDGIGLEGNREDSWEFVQSCLLKSFVPISEVRDMTT